jgi:hypothetical protein
MSSRAVPTDVDSLMASALLAISRVSESREGTSCEGKTGSDCSITSADRGTPEASTILSGNNVINGGLSSVYFVDAVPKLPPRLSSNFGFDTSQESKSLLSGYSAFPVSPNTQSIDAQVNKLALQAAMISDKAIAASLLKGTFTVSGIPLGGNVFLPFRADSNSSPTEPKNIRRQEIVKALHSKPQRGRKRANLNDIERQELTRTRNREHAKSTRVRKKMRYEELLNCEKALRENQFKENLDSRRRASVVDFLSIREQMLQNSFLPSSLGECNFALKLGKLVEDISALIFYDGLQQPENSDALDQMNQFDAALSTIIFRECSCKHDITFAKSILYRIRGSSSQNDVALTTFGIAFAEVDVVIRPPENDLKVVRSYLLKVEFASESEKIRSVSIIPLVGADERPEILENQISHPSVVSLEAEKDPRRELESHSDKQAESDDGGLGSGVTF